MIAIAIAIANRLPEPLRTRALFRIGTSITPMMRYVKPKLVELTDARATIRVDVSRRTRNPFNAMFFGALATGADCAASLFPMKFMLETGHRAVPLVKAVHSEYHKKVSGYAHFTCIQGGELREICELALATGERHDIDVNVIVTAPGEFGEEPVARITQVMSIRVMR
ncbi:MAG: PaaI family thioesterase [Burkholderiales bacterium]